MTHINQPRFINTRLRALETRSGSHHSSTRKKKHPYETKPVDENSGVNLELLLGLLSWGHPKEAGHTPTWAVPRYSLILHEQNRAPKMGILGCPLSDPALKVNNFWWVKFGNSTTKHQKPKSLSGWLGTAKVSMGRGFVGCGQPLLLRLCFSWGGVPEFLHILHQPSTSPPPLPAPFRASAVQHVVREHREPHHRKAAETGGNRRNATREAE